MPHILGLNKIARGVISIAVHVRTVERFRMPVKATCISCRWETKLMMDILPSTRIYQRRISRAQQ